MRIDSSSMQALLALFILSAMEMSSPLITHLCTVHSAVGGESADSFSRKYCEMRLLIFLGDSNVSQ